MSNKQGFVGSDNPGARQAGSKRRLVALIAAVIILIGAGGGLYLIRQSDINKAAAHAREMEQDKKNYDEALRKSRTLKGLRKNDEAIGALKTYAETSKNLKYKTDTYVKIGTMYEVQKQPKTALEYYRKAEKLQPEPKNAIAVGIARTSYTLGDKQTALEYYRLSYKLLKDLDDPAYAINTQATAALIKQIEAEQ